MTRNTFCILQLMKERSELPVFNSRDHILQAINNNPVVIIRGETGCGKTTQVRSNDAYHEILKINIQELLK